jgi:histidyl-tRNA synthetase
MGIDAVLDGKIVRGLDYYTRTVFEFIDAESRLTVCGGGRYDRLIEECGGPAMGAVGFGMGLERLIMMLEEPGADKTAGVYIGAVGGDGFIKAQALANELRKAGVAAEADVMGRAVKAQMKYADKTGARFSMIIGENELASGVVSVKNMLTGEQTEKTFDDLPAYLGGFVFSKS